MAGNVTDSPVANEVRMREVSPRIGTQIAKYRRESTAHRPVQEYGGTIRTNIYNIDLINKY
jgi:hypothetical protein